MSAVEECEGCYLHPALAPVATCVACGRPICGTCKSKSDPRDICFPCLADEPRAEGGEAEAAPPPDSPFRPYEKCRPLDYLKAFCLAGGAAVILAFLWGKFAFAVGRDSLLVDGILGAAVGFAVRIAVGWRNGPLLPWIGAAQTALAYFIQRAWVIQDLMIRDSRYGRKMAELPLSTRLIPLLETAFRSMEPQNWVFLAVAVLCGWLVPVLTAPFGKRAE